MSLYFDKGANRSLSNLDAAGEEKFTDKQDTLVSGENIKTINGVSVLGEGNIEVGEGGTITVNQTYDPTSSYAQSGTAVADALANSMESITQNGTISNCILEIPQNIKMEISGSNVICKAGSVLVNSGSTYQTITLTQDCVQDCSNFNDTTFLFMVHVYGSGPAQMGFALDKMVSGATDSLAGTPYHAWFDTETKVIKRYSSDPNSYTQCCYPCALVQVTSGVPSFAKDSNGNDMIFNGAGFIGHHAFVYPNVKALIPNGFNQDGTYKSEIYTTNALSIVEMTSVDCIMLDKNSNTFNGTLKSVNDVSEATDSSWRMWYVKNLNKLGLYYNNIFSIRYRVGFIDYAYDGTTVTQFDIRQPYEGARNLLTDDIEEEVATKQVDVTTLTGYDSTQTQTLKNINGVLTWVTD